MSLTEYVIAAIIWYISAVPAVITIRHTPKLCDYPIEIRLLILFVAFGPLLSLVCLDELVNIHRDRRSLYQTEIRRARRLRVQLWRQYYKAGEQERDPLRQRFERLDDSIKVLRMLPRRPEVPLDLRDVDLDLNEFHEKIEMHRRAIVEATNEMKVLDAA
jgi:hypothetical protein